MKMSVKRDLLLKLMDTVLQDCNIEPREDERAQLTKALRERAMIGDLLTESVCLARVPVRWYSDPAEARKELSPKFFSELFSWAAYEEEKIRGNRGPHDGEIVGAMQSYVSRIDTRSSTDLIGAELNRVWLGWRNGLATAGKVGWYTGVPREIVGYIGGARAAMPSIGISTLLDSLLFQHRRELRENEGGSWEPGRPFVRAVVAALESLRADAIEPWAGPTHQNSLW